MPLSSAGTPRFPILTDLISSGTLRLHQETPLPQPRLLSGDGTIRSRPVLGGLHHAYFRAAA